jgi:hypothetical protein
MEIFEKHQVCGGEKPRQHVDFYDSLRSFVQIVEQKYLVKRLAISLF